MPNLSIRGLETADLVALKALAARESSSVNTTVLRLLSQGLGKTQGKPEPRRFDDLDALAGTWSAQEADAFAKATAGFESIEPALWK